MADADLQAALDSASDRIDGIIGTQFPPPILTPYPMDLIECECVCASWTALMVRGYRPAVTGVDEIERRYKQWDNNDPASLGWMQRVANGEYVPKIVSAAANSDTGASGPSVITAIQRGFSERGIDRNSPPTSNTDPFSGN
jgi:phage gp36-like protein